MNKLQQNPEVSTPLLTSFEKSFPDLWDAVYGIGSRYSMRNFEPLGVEGRSDLENLQVQILQKRFLKWDSQRRAKRLLCSDDSFVDQTGSKVYMKNKWSRLRDCFRVSFSPSVGIQFSENSRSAHFSGLVTCGSVCACPVCASYISSVRCKEIETGFENHFKLYPAGGVYMMVLTNSHRLEDVLSDSRELRKEAKAFFDHDKGVKNSMLEHGVYGKINSFEITYSRLNGWHPHNHILLFTQEKIDTEKLKRLLSPVWIRALNRVGLDGSDDKALTVWGGEKTSKYITKLAQEISLAHSKLGKFTGGVPHYSPFQLLQVGESWADDAFKEYANTMRGKKFIVWSRGLKKKLGVVEVEDSEAVQPQEVDLVYYALVSSADWSKLWKTFPDPRPVVLRYAEQGFSVLRDFLLSVGCSVDDSISVPFSVSFESPKSLNNNNLHKGGQCVQS